MSKVSDAIREVSSGVANITLERNRRRLGSGSAFLTADGLVTADHVLAGRTYDAAVIRFDDDDPTAGIRLDSSAIQQMTSYRSPENQLDLAILAIDEPELEGRHRFELDTTVASVGTRVLIMGYPYDAPHLSSHVGYVSAAYLNGPVQYLQLDASVNPSNSGGPVVDPHSLCVVGYVTRAQTGLAEDFDDLIEAFRANNQGLQQPRASISIGGVDPVQGLAVTMASMEKLALNMKRSANVGIGYAFGAQHIEDHR